jgi:hypothetical protein
VRTKAPGGLARPLRRITHHLTVSQFPLAKTDFNIARGFLLGCFAGEDQRTASIALARILRGRQPLDQGLREILAEEIELAAQGEGRILQLKSTKRRMDPHRNLFIALEVVHRWQQGSSVDQAIEAVSQENNLGMETVRKSWQALQAKLKLPTGQRRARQR